MRGAVLAVGLNRDHRERYENPADVLPAVVAGVLGTWMLSPLGRN